MKPGRSPPLPRMADQLCLRAPSAMNFKTSLPPPALAAKPTQGPRPCQGVGAVCVRKNHRHTLHHNAHDRFRTSFDRASTPANGRRRSRSPRAAPSSSPRPSLWTSLSSFYFLNFILKHIRQTKSINAAPSSCRWHTRVRRFEGGSLTLTIAPLPMPHIYIQPPHYHHLHSTARALHC